MYTVELIHEYDLAQLQHVWEASVKKTHHFLEEEYFLWIRSMLPSFFPLVDLRCIRDDAGTIIAFSGVADQKLEMLFVHPDWFRRGLGMHLVQHAIEYQEVELVDVNEENEEAVNFYKKLGFVTIGRSDLDSQGRPHPIVHMKFGNPGR